MALDQLRKIMDPAFLSPPLSGERMDSALERPQVFIPGGQASTASPCDPCLCGCLLWKNLCRMADGPRKLRQSSSQPSLVSAPSLSCSAGLSTGSGLVEMGALQPEQDRQEPGDDSSTHEKREGAQCLLRFYYLLNFAERQTCIQIWALTESNCVTLSK